MFENEEARCICTAHSPGGASALAWCASAHCSSSGVQPPAGLHLEHLHSPTVRGWVLRISLSTGAKDLTEAQGCCRSCVPEDLPRTWPPQEAWECENH
ncbi:Bifunctional Glutamate/Proline--Trna Ligase [Manis pentadactyla]|nr:Bifunctional Glutamate/Proline--Trna Ligase [Manis pentadactyla]